MWQKSSDALEDGLEAGPSLERSTVVKHGDYGASGKGRGDAWRAIGCPAFGLGGGSFPDGLRQHGRRSAVVIRLLVERRPESGDVLLCGATLLQGRPAVSGVWRGRGRA